MMDLPSDTETREILREMSERLEELDPQLKEIFQQLRGGQLDSSTAIQRIALFATENPEWSKKIELELAQVLQPRATLVRQDQLDFLARWGMEEKDLIYQAAPNRLPQLHPLLQAMIGELLQFDGDVPELRTGRLPEGGTPAVPVQTQARDPVMIGLMLDQASQEVHLALQHASDTVPTESSHLTPVLELVPSIPGYEVGRAPALRQVTEPEGLAVAKLTLKKKQELWHKALTSTQGRKSIVPVLAGLILADLQDLGLDVQWDTGTVKPDMKHIQAEWTIEIYGSKAESNPRFSYIDMAARLLSRRLQGNLDRILYDSKRFTLHVRPINTVEVRIVGWQATLSPRFA